MGDYEMGELRRDRFSELPSSLIFHILSFLPMRDVFSTSLLSKDWINLWTTVPCLNFHNIRKRDNAESIRNFINRALISWKGTKNLNFEIDIETYFKRSFAGDIDRWICFAVENQVEDLYIDLGWEGDVYMTPQCLNSCSSLRELSLLGCSLRIHGSPAWNQLKTLKILDSCLGEEMVNQILLGTPQLDDLDLCLWERNENLNILSTSLKKLKIDKYFSYDDDDDVGEPSVDTVLKICCPNLETLQISGVLYGKCLLINVASLTDATLGFDWRCYNFPPEKTVNELLGETLRKILPSIQHIEKVALSFWCLEALGVHLKKQLLSPLPNIKFLKLYGRDKIELGDIMNLLGIFPNLQKLVIEDEDFSYAEFEHDPSEFNAENLLEFETNLSKSFSLQLKTIEVTSFMCYTSIYQLIRFLSKHAHMLEKLVILAKNEYNVRTPTYFLKVAQVLLNMPRSSTTAKVVFKVI